MHLSGGLAHICTTNVSSSTYSHAGPRYDEADPVGVRMPTPYLLGRCAQRDRVDRVGLGLEWPNISLTHNFPALCLGHVFWSSIAATPF